ncbi:hypothetical protein [Sphingomonas oryzagri]
MQQRLHYDPIERQREKQCAREQDERDLRAGVVSVGELNERNGFFSGIDFSHASIRRRRRIAA